MDQAALPSPATYLQGAPVSTELHEPQPEAPEEAAAQVAAPEIIADSLGEYARIWWRRVRSGESGALPVIIGLIAIVVYFQVRSSLFLSAGNLVNLMTQAAWIIMLGMAEVFVLLLGEIDLSIGYSSVIGAVITCWLLSLSHPVPWWLAVSAGDGMGEGADQPVSERARKLERGRDESLESVERAGPRPT